MNIKQFVKDLTSSQQEELLRELVSQDRIFVHVDSKSETFPVEDVYDNSSRSNKNLTILLVDVE
jgi:hypothetical protein